MVDPTTRKAPAKKAKIIPSRSQAKVSNDTNVSSSRAPHPSVGFSGKLSTWGLSLQPILVCASLIFILRMRLVGLLSWLPSCMFTLNATSIWSPFLNQECSLFICHNAYIVGFTTIWEGLLGGHRCAPDVVREFYFRVPKFQTTMLSMRIALLLGSEVFLLLSL